MKFNPNCQKFHSCEDCRDRCIKDIAFLYGLPEGKQIDMLRHSVYKSLRRGDFVFHEGDSTDAIVIIQQGQVKLSAYEVDGRENIIGIFSDNDTIWEGVFSAGQRYPYSAVCLTTTHCRYIRRTDVEQAISDPKVAIKVIHMLSNKLHDANERSRILSLGEPVRRVAAFLLYREKRSDEPYITLHLDDIAGSVGLRAETVSRNIRRLVGDGLIEKVGRSGFRIPDYDRLNSFVSE